MRHKKRLERHKKDSEFNGRVFFPIFLLTFFISFSLIYFFAFKKPFKKQPKGAKNVFKEKVKYSPSKVKEFLNFKNYFYYEPLELIENLKKKRSEILVVDCRDKESFGKEHIKTAVLFQSIEQVLKLAKNEKTIILYGSYQDEPKVNEIALSLIDRGLKVKVLSVGYNQFRHLKIFWLPQSLWDKIEPAEVISTGINL